MQRATRSRPLHSLHSMSARLVVSDGFRGILQRSCQDGTRKKLTVRWLSTNNNPEPYSGDFLHLMKKNISVSVDNLRGTIVELMAKQMNENDMQALASYWGKTLGDKPSPNAVDVPISVKTDSLVAVSKPDGISDELDQTNAVQNSTISVDTEVVKKASQELNHDRVNRVREVELFHPLLGELVADLGYKAIYRSNVRSIALAPVWKKQRTLRSERAALIVQNKIKNKMATSIPGTITYFMDSTTRAIGIVDGQHRAAALVSLAQKGYWDEFDRNILIEVFMTENDKEVAALFREINCAEPVRLIDLPEHDYFKDELDEDDILEGSIEPTSIASDIVSEVSRDSSIDSPPNNRGFTEQQIIAMLDGATEQLQKKFPSMFKPSSRCKSPHVNIDVLRDDLFQADTIQRNSSRITNTADLVDYLLSVNNEIGAAVAEQETPDKIAQMPKSTQNALKKAIVFKFYLGLNKSWMYKQ